MKRVPTARSVIVHRTLHSVCAKTSVPAVHVYPAAAMLRTAPPTCHSAMPKAFAVLEMQGVGAVQKPAVAVKVGPVPATAMQNVQPVIAPPNPHLVFVQTLVAAVHASLAAVIPTTARPIFHSVIRVASVPSPHPAVVIFPMRNPS